MEKYEIKPLLEGKLALMDLDLLDDLTKDLKEVYASFGKHNVMQAEQIIKDVEFMASRMNEAIKLDSRFKSLRKAEIKYCLQQGVRGVFSDKGKLISLSTIFSWLTEYLNSADRRAAMSEWVSAQAFQATCDVKQARRGDLSDSEYWSWIRRSYDSYLREQELQTRKIIPTLLQSGTSIAARDAGGCQTRFLKKLGYLRPDEKFKDFLDRMVAAGGQIPARV